MNVYLSEYTTEKIKNGLITAKNLREIGGLFLGHLIAGSYYIVAVTLTDDRYLGSMTSFRLDGILHARLAKREAVHFKEIPQILGIWHSHICSGTEFSNQDQRSNHILAEALDGALSMVVTWDKENQTMDMAAYYISSDGRETECQLYVKEA